ncbi:hypothetical protein M0E87_11910 [Corynebacterium sp. CCM 9185]|uniref:hypothetical protein n=1 Tax=Corynebacterium marambiense TaxID=2765364 RepID=UPI0018E6C722|nr:hypothetical protein [Corynebacterium marambiense]MCK7664353.1 hypothetical protein [Corynebacterium marambiense]
MRKKVTWCVSNKLVQRYMGLPEHFYLFVLYVVTLAGLILWTLPRGEAYSVENMPDPGNRADLQMIRYFGILVCCALLIAIAAALTYPERFREAVVKSKVNKSLAAGIVLLYSFHAIARIYLSEPHIADAVKGLAVVLAIIVSHPLVELMIELFYPEKDDPKVESLVRTP